mmetsp:Transcript_56748/g.179395  ORF Transcript_56748/g.179395 Transcript_56748/m.179395 type:complete len:496 (-) Transcript_56748:611-2098(-)
MIASIKRKIFSSPPVPKVRPASADNFASRSMQKTTWKMDDGVQATTESSQAAAQKAGVSSPPPTVTHGSPTPKSLPPSSSATDRMHAGVDNRPSARPGTEQRVRDLSGLEIAANALPTPAPEPVAEQEHSESRKTYLAALHNTRVFTAASDVLPVRGNSALKKKDMKGSDIFDRHPKPKAPFILTPAQEKYHSVRGLGRSTEVYREERLSRKSKGAYSAGFSSDVFEGMDRPLPPRPVTASSARHVAQFSGNQLNVFERLSQPVARPSRNGEAALRSSQQYSGSSMRQHLDSTTSAPHEAPVELSASRKMKHARDVSSSAVFQCAAEVLPQPGTSAGKKAEMQGSGVVGGVDTAPCSARGGGALARMHAGEEEPRGADLLRPDQDAKGSALRGSDVFSPFRQADGAAGGGEEAGAAAAQSLSPARAARCKALGGSESVFPEEESRAERFAVPERPQSTRLMSGLKRVVAEPALEGSYGASPRGIARGTCSQISLG